MVPLSVLDLSPIVEGSDAGSRFAIPAISRAMSNGSATGASGWPSIIRCRESRAPRRQLRSPSSGRRRAASASARAGSCFPTTRRWSSPSSSERSKASTLAASTSGSGERRAPTRRRLMRCAATSLRRRPASRSDVVELMGYFRGENGRVRAIPGEGLDIPVWILGSSLFGAQLAAMLGLPYAFASHFAPQMMMEAIQLYRERFEPSDQLDKPYVMLGFNAIVADTRRGSGAARDVGAAGVRVAAHRPSDQAPAAASAAMPTSCRWKRARSFVRSSRPRPSEARRPRGGRCRSSLTGPGPMN